MNRFEQAIYDCMVPTEDLLDETTKPLHRAMLLNFWRHVHLEGAGEYEQIVAPDMMVDEPVYRVTWGVSPAVITGKKGGSRSTTASATRCCGTQTTAWPWVTGESATRSQAVTPARVREIHREQLAKLEAARGERFWVLEQVAAGRS